MTHLESEFLTTRISEIISTQTPYVEYSDKDITAYSPKNNYGIYDKTVLFVINRLCECLNITDEGFLSELYKNARRLNAKAFLKNPYIKNIKIPDIKKGSFHTANMKYDRGELLLYDMPSLNAETVTPKIGFFDKAVSFPAIYEGNVPWLSVIPSEINSMASAIAAAHGKALVLGLGLGYYAYMISLKENVEAVTVVELKQEVIDIFNENILPQFEQKKKITVVKADAVEYLNEVQRNDYDFCFADIWLSQIDGAEPYLKIKRHEKRLPNTEFTYWIEDAIKWHLKNIE